MGILVAVDHHEDTGHERKEEKMEEGREDGGSEMKVLFLMKDNSSIINKLRKKVARKYL